MENGKPDNLLNDSIIGHYRIISKIGKGGMGEVYLAQDTKLNRKAAIKFLNQELGRDAEKLNRFIQEAKAASALNHPNILTVYEIGEAEDSHYIVTEFIEGKTLRDVISRKESVSVASTLIIIIQIAEALTAAHEAGIVHRDIKPENIMFRPDGYVKVLDFGLAKLTEQKSIGTEDQTLIRSEPGVIRGTVAYMSPEQARGLPVDQRTDIWSFGVLLYEMLTGRIPFTGETATDMMLSIIQKEPPSLEFISPDLPNEIYFIVSKMLRKKTDERYQRMKSVLTDLRRVKQRLDYEEIERSLAPEDVKKQSEQIEQNTEIFDNQSSDPGESVSIPSSTASAEIPPPNNLATELSTMIGREEELKEIEGLLDQSGIRLLTITGVGGTGKTRLAQAVAHQALNEFNDGVYFISLAAINSAELVVPIIAQTLGVREESGKSLETRLEEFLSERKLLIVLDNFEQIAKAAPDIGGLLSGSKNLKILVTSRVRLQLRFEHEFPLATLAIPPDKSLTAEEIKQYPAVELFVERAKAVKPFFELTEENARSIAEICQRLDGLPLAIELAAVRIKLLTPRAILTRLSESLKILTGGARDLPERQQTMRGAIQWSYDLLDEEEQTLLDRFAVFAGGFSFEAAEEIAGAKADLRIDIFDGIASLVDKSLLVQREQADGEPRFRMLEVIREFAIEQLVRNDALELMKRLHAGYYVTLLENVEPKLMGAETRRWHEFLDDENDNARLALEWSLENEPEVALRIAVAISNFWIGRGYLTEGSQWLRAALDRNRDLNPKLRAKALLGLGSFSWRQGDLQAANLFYDESLRLSRDIGDEQLIARSITSFATLNSLQGKIAEARNFAHEALSIARELEDKGWISVPLNTLGEIARSEEEYESAHRYYKAAYDIAKEEGYKFPISNYAFNLAATACLQEDYQSARSYAFETLKGSVELGHKSFIGGALDIFAALAVKDGEPEKSAQLRGAAHAIYEEINLKPDRVDQNFIDRYESEARAVIGDEAYDAAFREGRKMGIEEAILLTHETE